MSTPGAVRHVPLFVALLSTLGFANVGVPGVAGDQASVLAAFVGSETFR